MRRASLVFALALTLAVGGSGAPRVSAAVEYPRRAPAFTVSAPNGWVAGEAGAGPVRPLDFRPMGR